MHGTKKPGCSVYQIDWGNGACMALKVSGTKVSLIVEGVRSVQMVRRKSGSLVWFSPLDGAEDLAMFRQRELLQTGLADKIEVELSKPSEQGLTENSRRSGCR